MDFFFQRGKCWIHRTYWYNYDPGCNKKKSRAYIGGEIRTTLFSKHVLCPKAHPYISPYKNSGPPYLHPWTRQNLEALLRKKEKFNNWELIFYSVPIALTDCKVWSHPLEIKSAVWPCAFPNTCSWINMALVLSL